MSGRYETDVKRNSALVQTLPSIQPGSFDQAVVFPVSEPSENMLLMIVLKSAANAHPGLPPGLKR